MAQQVNDNFNLSDADILIYLQSVPNRLQAFLLEVPIDQLRQAVEEKERLSDLRYLQERNRGGDIHRYNVLDYTINQVIKASYDEKIIGYFQYILATSKSRLQNHPQFGLKLVDLYPEKYYIGDHSSHINHAEQIEELYGIVHGIVHGREQQGYDQEGDGDDDGNQMGQEGNAQNARQSVGLQDEEEFVVDDSAIEEEHFDIIDDLQAKLRERKRRARNKRSHEISQQSTNQKAKPIRKLRTKHKTQQANNSDNESHSPTGRRTNKRHMTIDSQDDT